MGRPTSFKLTFRPVRERALGGRGGGEPRRLPSTTARQDRERALGGRGGGEPRRLRVPGGRELGGRLAIAARGRRGRHALEAQAVALGYWLVHR